MPEVSEQVANEFRAADRDNSGTLDSSELKGLLQASGVSRTQKQCEALLERADTDRSGKLSLAEVSVLFDAARLAEVFEAIDTDESGTIHVSELGRALDKLGHGKHLPPSALRSLVARVDTSGDGLISLPEFEAFFRFVPNASLEAVAEQLLSVANLDVGTDLAPPLPPAGGLVPVWECLVFGGIAGVASRTLTAPLERVKIQAQVGGLAAGVLGELRRIVSSEGLRGLWAGNGANCVRVFPFAGIVMLTYTRVLAALPSPRPSPSPPVSQTSTPPSSSASSPSLMSSLVHAACQSESVRRAGAGGFSGVVGTVLTYPIDVVRARLTLEGEKHGRSILSCANAIVRDRGWRGLYAGVGPTMCAVAPFLALQQSTYDFCKRSAIDRFGVAPSVPLFLGCSIVAGGVAQTVVYPLDLIRRRIQLGLTSVAATSTTATAAAAAAAAAASASASATSARSSVRSAAAVSAAVSDFTWVASVRRLLAHEGYAGAFAGIGPTYAKVLPSVMIAKTTADMLVAFGDSQGWWQVKD